MDNFSNNKQELLAIVTFSPHRTQLYPLGAPDTSRHNSSDYTKVIYGH